MLTPDPLAEAQGVEKAREGNHPVCTEGSRATGGRLGTPLPARGDGIP